jgi:stage II sporulation protein P
MDLLYHPAGSHGSSLHNHTLLPENPKPYLKTSTGETTSGNFYTVRDEKGMTIFQTGLAVHIDDRYISENDVEYVIIKIDGLNAQASIVQTQNKANPELNDNITSSTLRLNQAVPTVVAKPTHVVMYHTHDDESYIPTDGKASQPAQGGVLKVGEALTETLKNAGVSVTHNQDSHGPHDVNAYHRSRRTAVQLIKEQPDAILDIHRDSAPVKAYYTTINGIDCARVMIVIGRSNPNMKTNLAYARQIKASADKLYPECVGASSWDAVITTRISIPPLFCLKSEQKKFLVIWLKIVPAVWEMC